jgi:leader peptidase (prepilin peptidase)/N-methyltransferase
VFANEVFLLAVISGLYGLLLGSFANVVIYRVPEGLSVVKPRSACPTCDEPIGSRDNIPVLSWLILRGRCRHCSTSISSRYPLVELATGALFVVVALVVGADWSLPAHLWFAWSLVSLSMIDIDTHKLPNRLLYPCLAGSLVLLAAAGLITSDYRSMMEGAVGGLLSFAVMFVIWFFARGGLGYGDVRLAGLLGLHLGYVSLPHVPLGLFLGFFAGAAVGIVLLAMGRSRKQKLPFGPFLAVGALATLLWGQPLIDLYLGR